MQKFYILIITFFSLSIFSCNTIFNKTEDIEGSWSVYKAKYYGNSQFQKVTDKITFTFKNTSNEIGNVEIFTESNQQNSTGKYKLIDSGYEIEIEINQNGSTILSTYELDAGVGLMKLTNYQANIEYLLKKE